MTLAKALKKKNRLAGKVSKLQQEIQKENSARSDCPKKIEVEKLMTELEEIIKALIKIKIAIFVASTPQRENILTLSELKSQIVFLESINTQEGNVNEYGREQAIKYSVVFDRVWIKNRIEKCELKIDRIQDELDEFNHIANIEV